ncbi:hypothetical protein DPMN_149358 [Dreissena polymorpha]|uniref:Uncharacterized protein n=1 Tax=Dreissena polymorpha TaxID=45954 RepID=A0A9D4FH88_DREPO|nr:hypothetical protein DPMN_149358 [Dreissena polymorpha]
MTTPQDQVNGPRTNHYCYLPTGRCNQDRMTLGIVHQDSLISALYQQPTSFSGSLCHKRLK